MFDFNTVLCVHNMKKKIKRKNPSEVENMIISDLKIVAHLVLDPILRVVATNHNFKDRHKIRLLASKIGPKKGFAAALDTRISIPPY